jgi:hypothetical protein
MTLSSLAIYSPKPKRIKKPKKRKRALTHRRVVDIGNDAIQRIASAITKQIDADPAHWRRIRYAVSIEEWHCIAAAIKATGEPFYGRIKDVPLLVESTPDKPTLSVSY